MQEVYLTIQSASLADEEIQRLSQRLRQTLKRETPIKAESVAIAAEAGDKGLKEVLGKIKLSDVKKAIEPLLNVLKVIFERREDIELELQRADGSKATLKISKSHLQDSQINRTFRMMEQFLNED